MKLCGTLISLTLAAGAAAADVHLEWSQTYSDGVEFGSRALAVDSGGNSYVLSMIEVVSNDSDFAITRFDTTGALVWQQIYAGPNGQDVAVDIELSADHTAVFAVGRSSIPGFGNSDYAIIKYDADSGAELWQRFYDGPAGGIDDPRDAAATPDGGIIVTGGIWNDGERMDYGTVKFNADGDFMWDATFGDNGPFLFNDDRGEHVVVTSAGDVVVSGTARPASGGNDVVTFKYDGETGDLLWTGRYTTSANESVNDLALAPDEDVIVFGADPFGLDRRWLTIRYDGHTGAEQWVSLIDPGFDESPARVTVDDAGDVYVTGATDPDGDDGNINENLVVMSFEGDSGALRWLTTFGDNGFNEADFGADVWADGAGNLFVSGSSRSDFIVQQPFDADAILLKLDSADGDILETVSVDSTEDGGFTRTDYFFEIGTDADGELYVRGLSDGDVFVEPRLLLAKFDVGPQGMIGDLDGNGTVNAADLALLLGGWGPCADCAADLDQNGFTNAADLAMLLGNWN